MALIDGHPNSLRETALALSGARSRNLYGVDLSIRMEATVTDFAESRQATSAKIAKRNLEPPGALIDLFWRHSAEAQEQTASGFLRQVKSGHRRG